MAGFKESGSFRTKIRDQLKGGATHTEITINLLEGGDDIQVNHKHKYLTPDAVLSMFAAKHPELALKHKDALIKASKMSFSSKDADPKSYSLWALVNTHLYYPEISGKHAVHLSKDNLNTHLKYMFGAIKGTLEGNLTAKSMKHISKFTDRLSEHTVRVRSIIQEAPKLLAKYTDDPERDLRLLRTKGYVVLVTPEHSHVDPVLLHVIANPDEKVFLMLSPMKDNRLKVSMRAVHGKLTSSLYNSLNDEERSVRSSDNFDPWFGTEFAGGSPLDGTEVPFSRLSVIFSTYDP